VYLFNIQLAYVLARKDLGMDCIILSWLIAAATVIGGAVAAMIDEFLQH